MSRNRRLLALRIVGWLCVAVIAYLSLIPHSMEARTDLPPGVEHAIAYCGTAGLMMLAYPAQAAWLIVGALCAYSGLMELLQNFSMDRQPGVDGVLWSSIGAILGGYVMALLRSRRHA